MQLNERLAQFIGTVEIDRLLGPDARVARSLAGNCSIPCCTRTRPQARDLAGGDRLPLTASRQRVNQALQRLEKAGLVKIEYGRIRILDLEGLRNFPQ
jgi:CRP/FNR family transcriptional regulator, cyclic AMP receptor protein